MMQQQVMKRNVPSELGWGIGTDGGWSQQSSAPGNGSWTSATNQDSGSSLSSWQALNKSDSASDQGDDASSGKSGSTITSISAATSQSQETASTANTGLQQTSSSSLWSASNPTLTSLDSNPWGNSNSPAPSVGTIGWTSNSSGLSLSGNNQGLNNSMQPGPNLIGSTIGAASSSGWSSSITGNNLGSTSTLPPNLNSGMQTNNLSSQWHSSSLLGNIGDFSKSSDGGWSNPAASLLDSSKDLGGSNSDPRMWGFSSDKAGDSQWDIPKNQWGNPASSAADQGAGNAEMSFAQATLKGLKLPPATNTSQAAVSSRQEEILRAINSHEGWGTRPIRQDTSWDVETSPKSLRKFSTDGNSGANNVWNNSNGTAIWEAVRENQSTSWVGGGGGGSGSNGSSWNPDKDQPNWGNATKPPPPDSNTWNVANNADPKAFGTWGASSGAGDASNKMWGQKTEVGSWGDSSGVQRTTSITSWGDDGDSGSWEDTRRITSGMSGMQSGISGVQSGVSGLQSGIGGVQNGMNGIQSGMSGMQNMIPPSPGLGMPGGMLPQSMGMTAVGSDNSPWNDAQKPGWNSVGAVGVTRTNTDEPWNKPPPTRSGWGDPAHESVEVDNGTSIWAAGAPKQTKASNWGDTGTSSQWNAAVGAKPKMPSWEESLSLAQRAKQMPQKATNSISSHPPTQMRAKLLQHLMDMGFRKEEAQAALITNNMNIEMAINDLKAGSVNMSRKDLDIDVFQVNGSQSRMPYMSKGVLGVDDMSDIRPDQMPSFSNIQNTSFPNSQLSNQSFMQSNPNLPSSGLGVSNVSINSSLQQKLVQKMQQQQAPPSTVLGQRGPLPPVGSVNNSQVPPPPQQQQQQILSQLRQAVSNGFISPQLLNYQLPHNILLLLQKLLQLQTAQQNFINSQQQLLQQARSTGGRNNPQLEQISAVLSNINQQIVAVQKQLQQAQNNLFSTQKPPAANQPNNILGQSGINMMDSLDALSTDLANAFQSRLTTQWKPSTEASVAITADGLGTSTATTTIKSIEENGESKTALGKGMFQSASSPNLNLIPGGLGMTGDKTWSSNASTTASSNWPLSTDNTGISSHTEKSSSSSNSSTSLLMGLPSGLSDVIPEFVPGKPWQGLAKNVEDDPHVTPGSIQRSLSVNRVHDESLNHLDGHKLSSNTWDTAQKSDNSLGLSQLGNRTLPGMAMSKGIGGQQWMSGNLNRQTSWPHSSSSAFTKVAGTGWSDSGATVSPWILLRNLTVDPSTARALSAQHGTLISFYPLAQGQVALVQYSNRDSAFVAQQRLNNFQMGTSVISAEFINEADAQRVIAQIPPPQSNTMPTSPWSQAPPSTPFQNSGMRSGDPWSTSMPGSQLNTKFTTAGENLWGLWDRPDHNPNPLSNILGRESM